MDERNRLENAMDDLRAIRSVLDDTGGSFAPLAPASRALGVLWSIYAVLSIAVGILLPGGSGGIAFSAAGTVSTALTAAFCLALAAFCVVWGCRLPRRGLQAPAARLLTMWKIVLWAIVISRLVLNIALPRLVRLLGTGESAMATRVLLISAAAVINRIIPVLTLAIPLVITGCAAKSRWAAALGIVVLALTVIWALLLCVVDGTAVWTAPVKLAVQAVTLTAAAAAFLIMGASARRE